MKLDDRPEAPRAASRPAREGLRRTAVGLWDRLFGPPRVRQLPDGCVCVRLLGRRFDAATHDGLFDAVARERERLLASVREMHERSGMRAMPGGRGVSDSYHQATRRLEDRVSLYGEFLGRLARELQLDRRD